MVPFFRVRTRLVPAFLIVVLVISGATPALAAATLNAVRVDANPAGGALVSVNFAGPPPVFHVIGAGTPETSILLDNTSLGPQAPPSVAGAGPVTSVSVASTGTSSSLALHLVAGSRVTVRTGSNFLFIDVAASAAPVSPLGAFPQATVAPVTGGSGTITQVIELKYADISEIAGVLSPNSTIATNDTFSPTQTNIGTSSLSGSFGGVSGGFTSPTSPQSFGGGGFGQATGLAQRVNDNIAVDRRLNAIILTGTPDVVAGLREVIDKLDVPVASVILETQIIELSDTAAKNIGLDLSPDGSGVVANGAASPNGYVVKSLSTATGQLTFAGNLYAAVSSGNARIIAKPRILAQSGQQASILTGDALPILTSIVVGSGTTAVSNQVSYINVGVNLQILPRVSSDGFVSSHIYSEVSSVTNFTQGYPQISQRTASTLATVRDGQSFVIGGLLQDNEIRSLTKLPFISDLPLIGAFFRHVSNTHTQDNLYIIVTPHIVGRSGVVPPLEPLSIPSALPQIGPPSSTLTPAPFSQPLEPPKTVGPSH